MSKRAKQTAVLGSRSTGKKSQASKAIPGEGGDGREFPEYPRVGVGGIVVHNGQVLLVRRGQEPLKGHWSLPGGLVENGEELACALRRELKEETGLSVEPIEVIGVFERIERNAKSKGRPRYHYVVIDYICRLRGAQRKMPKPPAPRPATDITAARWVDVGSLNRCGLSDLAEDVIRKAFSLVQEE
jgi:8-oxo-dGTP diphosphatase